MNNNIIMRSSVMSMNIHPTHAFADIRSNQVGGRNEGRRGDLQDGRGGRRDDDRRRNARPRQGPPHDHGQRQRLRCPSRSLSRHRLPAVEGTGVDGVVVLPGRRQPPHSGRVPVCGGDSIGDGVAPKLYSISFVISSNILFCSLHSSAHQIEAFKRIRYLSQSREPMTDW